MVSYILFCVVGIGIMSYMMYVVCFGIVCYMVCCIDRYNEIYYMVSFGIMHEMVCCRY